METSFKRRKLALCSVAIFLATAIAPAAQSGELSALEAELVGLVARLRPSVVAVIATSAVDPETQAGRSIMMARVRASGVVFDNQGHIITVSSSIRGCGQIQVQPATGAPRPATFLGEDSVTDIAVLRVDPTGLVPAEFGDSDLVSVGSLVVAVGNPFGLAGSAALGMVSGVHRRIATSTGLKEDVIQTTALVNPGDSGGMLSNCRGEVIGIVFAALGTPTRSLFPYELDAQESLEQTVGLLFRGYSGPSPFEALLPGSLVVRAASVQGITFSVPSNSAKFAAAQIVKSGKVTRAWLGVGVEPVMVRVSDDPVRFSEKALVVSVEDGSPAAEAGIRPGDLIMSIDGRDLLNAVDLANVVRRAEVGSSHTLTVERESQERKFSVRLAQEPQVTREGRTGDVALAFGIRFLELNEKLRQALGAPSDRGVLVADVLCGSAAETAGLRPADVVTSVNGQAVASSDDCYRALGAGKSTPAQVEIIRERAGLTLILSPGP